MLAHRHDPTEDIDIEADIAADGRETARQAAEADARRRRLQQKLGGVPLSSLRVTACAHGVPEAALEAAGEDKAATIELLIDSNYGSAAAPRGSAPRPWRSPRRTRGGSTSADATQLLWEPAFDAAGSWDTDDFGGGLADCWQDEVAWKS
jgi:hypothetical protein